MADGNPSRVLVTGGAGFIGRHVVRALLDQGHDVTSADRHACTDERASSVVGDLRDPAVIADALRPGTDVVLHLAAVTSVLRSVQDPAGTCKLNVEATAGLLDLARQRGVGTFLLASTNAVTGDVGRTTISEQTPLRPLTPYGATKAAGEMLLAAYSASYGLTAAALRFSNVYGPGMEAKDSFVPPRAQWPVDPGFGRVGDGERYRRGRAISNRRGTTGRACPAQTWGRAGCDHRYLGREGPGVRTQVRSQGRHRHRVARILGDSQVTSQ